MAAKVKSQFPVFAVIKTAKHCLGVMIEALIEAAIEGGLEEEMAIELVLQTMYGSALLASQSKKSPKELREMVTSPGGTTEAALNILAPGLQNYVRDYMKMMDGR